jgi:hypothetical protein
MNTEVKDLEVLKRLIKDKLTIDIDKVYDWSGGMEIRVRLMWNDEEFNSSHIYLKADE